MLKKKGFRTQVTALFAASDNLEQRGSHCAKTASKMEGCRMQMTVKSRSPAAFTLIELLVVIAILALLMAFIVPRIVSTAERARVVKTRNDVVQIAAAWDSYFRHYRRWPASGAGRHEMNETLTDILLGDNSGGGNPEKMPFYDASATSTNSSGAMVNGWGNPIYVKFDHDLDNVINVNEQNPTNLVADVRKSAVVYSLGTNNDAPVWITSW